MTLLALDNSDIPENLCSDEINNFAIMDPPGKHQEYDGLSVHFSPANPALSVASWKREISRHI